MGKTRLAAEASARLDLAAWFVPLAPVTDPAEVASYGAVRLFRDRAVAVRPDFELSEANAAAVARICRALDGMPLAIELAAVWLRTLTPGQLAERLDDRFVLLTGTWPRRPTPGCARPGRAAGCVS